MAVDLAGCAYILICTAFVQLMTPGATMIYGGLLHDKNAVVALMKVLLVAALVSILWYFAAFSFCFGESVGFFGNLGTFGGMNNVMAKQPLMRDGGAFFDGYPGLLVAVYQNMFAVLSAALMTVAVAHRVRMLPYLVFVGLWLVSVYAPVCHWLWGNGWAQKWGVGDFAGGLVVHSTAGCSALAVWAFVDKIHLRLWKASGTGCSQCAPAPAQAVDAMPPVRFIALGVALLWFGWFGITGGSSFREGKVSSAVAATVNTQIAACVSFFIWVILDWLRYKRFRLANLCLGAIAGLVTISPAAGYVQPWAALVLGIMAPLICWSFCELRKKAGLDDGLDVFCVHAVGGFVGTVMVGAISDSPEMCGDASTAHIYCVNPVTVHRSGQQFGRQLAVSCACAAFAFTGSLIIALAINFSTPLAVHEGDPGFPQEEEKATEPAKNVPHERTRKFDWATTS